MNIESDPINGYLPYSFNEWLASDSAPEWLQTSASLHELYEGVSFLLSEKLSSAFEYVEEKENWWRLGAFGNDLDHGLKRQVERTTVLFQCLNKQEALEDPPVSPAERKGIETTLASLYIALHSRDQALEARLCAIHDAWCSVNYKYEGADKVREKRMAQYIPYEELSIGEKMKDKIWIEAIEHVLQ